MKKEYKIETITLRVGDFLGNNVIDENTGAVLEYPKIIKKGTSFKTIQKITYFLDDIEETAEVYNEHTEIRFGYIEKVD